MKKQLLFGFALAASVSVVAQSSVKRVAPYNATPKNMERALPAVCDPGPAQVTKTTSDAKSIKRTALVTYKRVGGSPNVLSAQTTETRALQYNSDINAVGFVHRIEGTLWPGVTNGNSGTIAYHWTTNNGTSWDSTVVAASGTYLHRYPAGAMYNPSGNTNAANAYAVASGPWHPGANWQGSYFASKALNGTRTANGNVVYSDNNNLQPTQRKQDFTRIDMQVSGDGVVHVLGDIAKNVNDVSSAQAYGWRGAMINKGVFNAGTFTWTVDSIIPNVKTKTNGDKILISQTNMAWSEDGQTGYVICYGVDANAAAKSPQNSYQPLVYKTTNAGASWARHAALFDFTSLAAINDRLFATRGVTPTIAKPFMTTGESSAATVDANGQLHLFISVNSAYSDNIDSLAYTYSPNYNQVWNYLYDLTTTATGWNAMIIDSLSCEGPTSDATAQSGVGSSQWVSSTGKIAYDARLQLSRTTDGKYITYAWTDSDSSIVSNHQSTQPDIYMKSFDVVNNKFTCKKNMSKDKTNIELNAFFFYASTTTVKKDANTLLIPATVTRSDDGSNSGDNPVSYYYIGDNTFSTNEYTVAVNAPGCTVGSGVGMHEQASSVSTLRFYPNPASTNGTLEISLNDNAKIDVTVMNAVGQVVYSTSISGNAGANKVDMNLSNLSNGIYFYQVKAGNNKAITNKFVIAK